MSDTSVLYLCKGHLRHVPPIPTHVQVLWLCENALTSLSELSGKLLYLPFSNIFFFQGAFRLRELHLDNNELVSLAGIEALKHLETLSIKNNNIRELSEISHLRGLTSLKSLDLSGNRLTDDPAYRSLSLPGMIELYPSSSRTVISQLPQIELLDCHPVTSTERQAAERWARLLQSGSAASVKSRAVNPPRARSVEDSPLLKPSPLVRDLERFVSRNKREAARKEAERFEAEVCTAYTLVDSLWDGRRPINWQKCASAHSASCGRRFLVPSTTVRQSLCRRGSWRMACLVALLLLCSLDDELIAPSSKSPQPVGRRDLFYRSAPWRTLTLGGGSKSRSVSPKSERTRSFGGTIPAVRPMPRPPPQQMIVI